MSRNNLPKLACHLHSALASYRKTRIRTGEAQQSATPAISACVTLAQRYYRAQQYGWHQAAARLRTSLIWRLDDVSRQTSIWRSALTRQLPAPASPHLLLQELEQVLEEFDSCYYEGRSHHLVVVTEEIELEGILLGAFEMRLSLLPADEPMGYPYIQVIAQDPHTAVGNPGIPHPHISGDQLCVGDGKAPVAEALQDGRLADLFLILQAILTTYNPDSAYVSLDNWLGGSCTDCDEWVSEDEICYCEHCEDSLCLGCIYHCEECSRSVCCWHASSCKECGLSFCSRCTETALEEDHCHPCREILCLDTEPETETEPTLEEIRHAHV